MVDFVGKLGHECKITGGKHAGNLGVGESIAPKSCALVPCA